MSRDDPPFKLRLPGGVKLEIERAATRNRRSMNAEIVARLIESIEFGERPSGLVEMLRDHARGLQAIAAHLDQDEVQAALQASRVLRPLTGEKEIPPEGEARKWLHEPPTPEERRQAAAPPSRRTKGSAGAA